MIINGIDWKILLVSSNHPGLLKSDGSQALGVCDNNIRTIYIDDSLHDTKFKKVLCHEITHAAMFSYNVNISHDQEELLADLIATYGEEIITITNRIFTRLVNR